MTDTNQLAAHRRAAFDRLRVAELEIHSQFIKSGKVPDEWWAALLRLIVEYRNAVNRCKGAL